MNMMFARAKTVPATAVRSLRPSTGAGATTTAPFVGGKQQHRQQQQSPNNIRWLHRDPVMLAAESSQPLAPEKEAKEKGGFLSKERALAGEGYNRWMAFPSVLMIQGSVGSIYAWSVFNSPLTKDVGVIAQCSQDWALSDVVPIFSTTAACFGCCAWGLGSFIEKIGPRHCGVLAATCWGGGLGVAGLGVMTHSLPTIYLGYGLLGGLGFAFGYLSPVANLIKWFPDKRGLATGIGVMAFGGGALLCAPLTQKLLVANQVAPDFVGSMADTNIVTVAGKRMAEVGGEMQEVVVASAEAVKSMPELIENGVYLAGTGDTGLSATFMTLGAMYTGGMLVGALSQRTPRPGYDPVTGTQSLPSATTGATATDDTVNSYVPIENVLKIPQFYLMWLATCGNAMAGVSIISCAKNMMGDIFGTAMPLVVDGAFAASFVAGISIANMGGRIGWATASDVIGRKNVYLAFGLVGIPAVLYIPQLTSAVALSPDPNLMWGFCAAAGVCITTYGGLLGILPAYISDTFGIKNTPSIFGRLMTGWAAAALGGPLLLTHLRGNEITTAINDLTARVNPTDFQQKFGVGTEQLQTLIESKAITIQQLMDIAPAGTIDPTCAIYDSSLYTMAGALGVALAANFMVHPIDRKWFITDKE